MILFDVDEDGAHGFSSYEYLSGMALLSYAPAYDLESTEKSWRASRRSGDGGTLNTMHLCLLRTIRTNPAPSNFLSATSTALSYNLAVAYTLPAS